MRGPAPRSPWLTLAVAAAGVLAVGVAVLTLDARQEHDFPHRDHAGLFPVCTGCHQGVPVGNRSTFYPPTDLCGRCHDGVELERVTWEGPARIPTNLRFDHPDHRSRASEEGAASECGECHTRERDPRMAAGRARPERCLACHEHEAERHYVDARCATCHRPLAETGFSLPRIEALPEPETHGSADFLVPGHGEQASADPAACATCHTRERCTSCHVDPAPADEIAGVPAAPEEMALPDFEARYPTPPSHQRDDWRSAHGARASRVECATCHVRESCTSCHRESQPDVVQRLASRSEARAPGAGIRRAPPESHASPFFRTDHGGLAAARPRSCRSCHSEATCTGCHASESGSGSRFHPEDFMAQHASAAYGRRLECSNCHDAAAFCRDCHGQAGLEPRGRLGGGFHDGVQLWLFRHGAAARQEMESCASCHGQKDCLQCHSETGAFRVNPHGPGFDAERYADRNREICFACHLDDPLTGGTP